jgi:hypothetical protein
MINPPNQKIIKKVILFTLPYNQVLFTMQWSLILPWYPVYGTLLIAFGILLAIWLVYIVEKTRQPPWVKMIIAIFIIALSVGFGIQLILVSLAL